LGRREGEKPNRRGEGRERLTDRMAGGRGSCGAGEGGQDRHREAVRGMETRASSWNARGERGAGGERHRRGRDKASGGGVAQGGKSSGIGNGGGAGIGWDGTRGVGGGSKGTGGGGAVVETVIAGGGRTPGRNAPAPTWPLRRRKTGVSRRLRIDTGGWDANLGRGWARPRDCRSGERGRWVHRGGGLGRPRGPGQRTRGLLSRGHRRRNWGGLRWGQAVQGQRRNPRKGREDRESN
jgi:hypothetical protein